MGASCGIAYAASVDMAALVELVDATFWCFEYSASMYKKHVGSQTPVPLLNVNENEQRFENNYCVSLI